MFDSGPDCEAIQRRTEAFWACEECDRPLTFVTFPKPQDEQVPYPAPPGSVTERWLDVGYQTELALARTANTVYYADALPVQIVNLGPEGQAAFYGCPLQFSESTSWTSPILHDWSETAMAGIRFDAANPYFRRAMELTDAFLAAGKGRFLTGLMPWLGAADTVAALRDPQEFCIDLIDHPQEVQTLCARITEDFPGVYEAFYARCRAAGQPASGWLSLTCEGRYYIAQNDISSLVSPAMFDEFLVPWTERECVGMDRCMYHLDGLQALKFLDRVLAIPDLHAVQWGPPPQYWDWRQWSEVYHRIQAAGKGFFLPIKKQTLPEVIERFDPRGMWLILEDIADEDEAKQAMTLINRWKRKGTA
jgi:hypothetical protein